MEMPGRSWRRFVECTEQAADRQAPAWDETLVGGIDYMTTTTHGERLRRRQIASQLLDAIGVVFFIPQIQRLRMVRLVLVVAIVLCNVAAWRYGGPWWLQAMITGMVWIAVEIILFRATLIETVREMDK